MALARPHKRAEKEPTIALINIVFLMLVFFMVAGTLAPPMEQVELVETADLEGLQPPDSPVLMPDGRLMLRDRVIEPEDAVVKGQPVRIVPDRAASALQLLAVAQRMAAAGASEVSIVTKRGLE